MCVFSSGFNPVWEETLSFTLHMAEVVLVRFLVWDHDPIGRDFIGQRTVAFSSLMPGLCWIPQYFQIYLRKGTFCMNDMNLRGDTVCHCKLESLQFWYLT